MPGGTRAPAIGKKKRQPACKPGSVGPEVSLGRGGHSSGTAVADRLKQPTRAADWKKSWRSRERRAAPIRFCSWWGLPCRPRYRVRGALLPHPFTLTAGLSPEAVYFLWHCPWGCPRRTLSGTTLPWSPDFPPRARRPGAAARPADKRDLDCIPINVKAEQSRCAKTGIRYGNGLRISVAKNPGLEPPGAQRSWRDGRARIRFCAARAAPILKRTGSSR
jgi:hypothetical protein